MATSKESDNNKKAEANPAMRQLGYSTLGELTAFSVAIGAVYVSELLFPGQTKAFVARLAQHLGKWRGANAETQTVLAKKIFDISIMNMAGIGNLAVQFGLRRAHQSPETKTPFWYEAGRLAVGRVFGTLTALGAFSFMGTRAPRAMGKMEAGVSRALGNSTHSARFAELLVSNAVLSVGAVAGNAPSQILYDYLVNAPEKSHER